MRRTNPLYAKQPDAIAGFTFLTKGLPTDNNFGRDASSYCSQCATSRRGDVMQRLIVSLISLAMTLGGVAARVAGDAKSEQLMAQARAALGGDSTLAKVQGLTATGTYQRDVGDRQLNGEVTIDLQLPDKMLRTERMRPMGDATIETLQGINGEQVLRNSRTLGGGPNMMIRIASPGGAD